MEGLSFEIRDRTNSFERNVVEHRGAEADLLWNNASTAFFVLDDDHPAVPAIVEPGAKVIVRFRGEEEFRGRVTATPGAGPIGHVTCYVTDFRRKLDEWQGWPKPAASHTGQNVEFRRYTGSLETIIKTAVAENVARLGRNWVMAADQGRAPGSKPIDFRMDFLGDLLWPPLRDTIYGLVLSYPGNVPTLDLRTPETVGGILDASSGRVDTVDYSRRAPTATRATIGGPGEGAARKFDVVIDAAREALWDDITEVFVNSARREATDDLKPDGRSALDAGAATTSIAMELTEQESFRYREHYQLGDLLPVRLGAVSSTEVIQRVLVKDDPKSGITITPSIGDLVRNEIHLLTRQLARLQANVRTQGRR